ncbi:AtpZ/AtpI family protein [Calorimonas adulescens]|jgi:Putative F0F1-ATPase subunit (ATPase_gene1).|uniref:AtpZ/AtpI family protein n=1 Tax=Calorimonas adulescens TaxID=2606906 RepID=A0A5D8QB00_9THEO|nr:AtpZ/AtpI family protein [Calorimonas adulescens]TZE81304.1 AtpZ/AtpI family protein [Calorimonas adulescens]
MWDMLSLFTYLGLYFGLPIILGIVLGRALDLNFQTQPIFLIIFLLLGVTGTFFNMYQYIKKGDKIRKK